MKALIKSALALAAIFALIPAAIFQVWYHGRKSHQALRMGMSIRDIAWPTGRMVWIACDVAKAKSITWVSERGWTEAKSGAKALPEECKKLEFHIGGYVPAHAFYSVELDDNWNVKAIGKLRFVES